ncbi:MAG: outer membrane lipid asymmetry maintenance protein MlaD [Pseudomonadota bacterium]|uniref:Outer membrane lipid asymmetry maintenance protein MlaD n=1 Tax=Candidatus Desulfatibia profunda TaxID=2841695 RepID=A0A8J6NQ26_9BACT|nr:outer membrane lipid asymmetry maintenance protein MlaD [Candidatus Desulfatibia profunda]MBL7180455.1 outer membrane lipid asymmetry maintenance protein MlaD [Desulfobacterales bacterium]
MKRASIEVAVGIFMLIGIACVGYLSIRLGEAEWGAEKYYSVFARFQSVSGLIAGAHIELAGVYVGKVDSITLDPKTQAAVVKLKIQKTIVLSDDVIASIKTSGLIGDKYLQLSPGSSDRVLKPGEMITETESAVDIEALISKYVFGGAK